MNYVEAAYTLCPICGVHETARYASLSDNPILLPPEFTGMSLCFVHRLKTLFPGRYVFIEVDESKCVFKLDGCLQMRYAWRTGRMAYITVDTVQKWPLLCSLASFDQPYAFITPDVFEIIQFAHGEVEGGVSPIELTVEPVQNQRPD